MKRINSTVLILVAALGALSGCIERELPVPVRTPNQVNLVEANVGSDYESQLFFSLKNNRVEASCKQRDWCIALREASGTSQLMLNSGRAMKTRHTGINEFNTPIDPNSVDWEIMEPSGINLHDSSSLQLQLNELVLVDLGLDEDNESLGTLRLSLIGFDDESWLLRVADLEGTNSDTITVQQIDGYEWHQVSLIDRMQRQIEPPAEAWELCITQYMELLDGEIPYLVVGILTPTQRVRVFETDEVDWDTWKTNSWDELVFSSSWNAIGYDWKIFDLSTSSYSVDFDKLYCIRTEEGREFMMRMLDFYDANGNTGNVTFEVLER